MNRFTARAATVALLTGMVIGSASPALGNADHASLRPASVSNTTWATGPDGQPVPPGGVRKGNEVHYDNGAVVLRFDLAAMADRDRGVSALAFADCDPGYYCFFQNINYGGRMLQFRDSGVFQYLSNYGFANQASSWRSRVNTDTRVWNSSGTLLWCSDSQSSSSVARVNDRANRFYIQTTDGYC